MFLNFLNFYAIFFFWIFLYLLRLERTRNEICFSLIHSLSHPIQVRNKAGMMFFNFLNIYTIFWEFSILGWVGMNSELNFLFCIPGRCYPAFPIQFWLEIKSKCCFQFFEFLNCFFKIFLNRVGQERTQNNFFFFPFSAFPIPFWLEIKPE